MRIFSLLMAMLWGLGLVSKANAAEPQNSSSQTAVNSSSADLISPSTIVGQDFVRVPASDRHYSWSESVRDQGVTCFTMHTFLVKREGLRSDVIEPVGESTCLAEPRYSVRTVEKSSGKDPSR